MNRKFLRRIFSAQAVVIIVVLALLNSGCSKTYESAQSDLEGSWRAVYDSELEGEPTETVTIVFSSDGKMTYNYGIALPEISLDETISVDGIWKAEDGNLTFEFSYAEDEIVSKEDKATYTIEGDVLKIKFVDDDASELELKKIK